MSFVDVDDLIVVSPCHSQKTLHCPKLPCPLSLINDGRLFVPDVLLLPDAGFPINFSEKCWIQMDVRKIPSAVDNSVGKRHSYLSIKSLLVRHPSYLMLLEEAIAIPLSFVCFSTLFHLFDQRKFASQNRFESGLDQPSDQTS